MRDKKVNRPSAAVKGNGVDKVGSKRRYALSTLVKEKLLDN